LVIEGKLAAGVDIKNAEAELQVVLDEVMSKKITDDELTKQKNRIESQMEFAETEVLNKAMNLAYAELLGDANIANTEKEQYLAVTPEQILAQAQSILRPDNCSTMYYFAKQKN